MAGGQGCLNEILLKEIRILRGCGFVRNFQTKNESGVKCEAHANLLLPVLYQFWGMRDFRRTDNKLEDPTGIQ